MINKLILLLVLPISGLIFFTVMRVTNKMHLIQRMSDLQELSLFAVKTSLLVHELQKEKGQSAGYIGSKGKRFAEKLFGQRHNTDKKIKEFKYFLQQTDISKFGPKFTKSLNVSLGYLALINEKRESISALNISFPVVWDYYSNMNSSFLRTISHLSLLSSNVDIFKSIFGYVSLLKAKEYAGRERGAMSNVFAKGRYASKKDKRKIDGYVAKQETYLETFLSLATDKQKQIYREKISLPCVSEFEKTRRMARNQYHFEINAEYWFRIATCRIDLLKEVEDQISGDLNTWTNELKASTRFELLLFLILAGGASLITFFLVFLITRSITRPLTSLVNHAEEITKTGLLEETAVLPGGEFGLLTKAFNKMIREIKKMHDEHKKLYHAITQSPVSVIITDSYGIIEYVNPKFTQATGYTLEEAIGKNPRILKSGKQSLRYYENLWETISSGKEWRGEFHNKAKTGKLFWEQASISPIKDKDENITHFIAIKEDITKQKEINEKIKRSEGELKSTLKSIGDAVITINLQGKISMMNPVAKKITGWPNASGRNIKDIFKIIDEESRKEIPNPLEKVLKEGTTVSLENHTLLITKSGREIPIDDSGAPIITSDGKMIGAVLVFRDTTEKRREQEILLMAKEQAEAATKTKSEFLAKMSHEIRTPMNGVFGMAELLLDTELSTEQMEFVTIVKSSADSLLKIINDILDFSKMEAGKFTIEAIEFDLKNTIENAIQIFTPLAHKKGLELILDIETEIENYLIGDPGRLKQIFINLIGNAIKFTEAGEVVVKVEDRTETNGIAKLNKQDYDDKIFIKFSVADTGIGIPPDKSKEIFEDFKQGDDSLTRKYGGTGLGLAISQQLAGLMGGLIKFTSKKNKGTSFYFTLPFVRSKKPITRHTLDEDQKIRDLSLLKKKNIKILAAEDNPVNQRLLEVMLKKMNCSAKIVSNGKIALEALANEDFDLILLDIEMPILNGIEATREIRKQEKHKDLPILAITAHTLSGDKEKFMAAGMNDSIAKPIDFNIMMKMIIKHTGSTN